MIYPELNGYAHILNLENEEWGDIDSHRGFYQVSNLGRVKRLKATQVNRNQSCEFPVTYKERILKASPDSNGYPQVCLKFCERRVARVHRLVGEAFLGTPSPELVGECRDAGLDYVPINHIDSNPMNPHLSNLEWCSPSLNMLHSVKHGRFNRRAGGDMYNAILSAEDVVQILELIRLGDISQQSIADIYGVKQITISNIVTGRSWNRVTGLPVKRKVIRNP